MGEGRKDESGDFTKGAGLKPKQITPILAMIDPDQSGDPKDLGVSQSASGEAGPALVSTYLGFKRRNML